MSLGGNCSESELAYPELLTSELVFFTSVRTSRAGRTRLYRQKLSTALGEKWLGTAPHVQDLAIFTLGTGVGGGLMLDGKIWQ